MYNSNKHKLFISYYHYDDQWYKDYFEQRFGHLFINKSVRSGDINTDISTEYIKRLIQSEDYLADASVVMVLCGPNTKYRKHVDWEISGALNNKVNGCSGLMGILLPEFPRLSNGNYRYDDLPNRLTDNVKSGYASVYDWQWLCSDENNVVSAVNNAYDMKCKTSLIFNSRLQMHRNVN